jgi:hypothetical protein
MVMYEYTSMFAVLDAFDIEDLAEIWNRNHAVFFPCFVSRDRPASWLDYQRVALAGRVASNLAEPPCRAALAY